MISFVRRRVDALRLRDMLVALWPVMLFFTLFMWLCVWRDVVWPSTWHVPVRRFTPEELALIKSGAVRPEVSLQDFLLFVLFVAFLFTKSNLMLRRMGKPNRVTISISLSNLGFASLYGLLITGTLFPYFFAKHPAFEEALRTGLRIYLVSVLAWGILTLINTPNRLPYSAREYSWSAFTCGTFLATVVVLVLG